MRETDEFNCPNCGAEVPVGALACPECGSDEKTGWSENTIYDGTGIEVPEEFDYAEWQRREAGRSPRQSARQWLWWVVAVALVAALVWWLLAVAR